jgi:Fe2+ transport system protein FeoA
VVEEKARVVEEKARVVEEKRKVEVLRKCPLNDPLVETSTPTVSSRRLDLDEMRVKEEE